MQRRTPWLNQAVIDDIRVLGAIGHDIFTEYQYNKYWTLFLVTHSLIQKEERIRPISILIFLLFCRVFDQGLVIFRAFDNKICLHYDVGVPSAYGRRLQSSCFPNLGIKF